MVVTYALQKGMLVCSHYIVKIDGNILIVEGLQVTTKNFATDWPDDTWSKKVHCYEGNLLCRECLHCHNVSLDVHPMVHDEKKKKVNATRVTCFVVNAYVVTISRQNKQNWNRNPTWKQWNACVSNE